jgi:chromosome segregation ATPase
VLDALISGLEKIGAISSDTASSLKTYISSIQELVTGIMSGDVASALVGSITLLSQIVSDISSIVSFYNQQTITAISSTNRLKVELEEIDRKLEDIKDRMREIYTTEDIEIALDELTKALDEKFKKQLDITNEYYRKQINETQSEIERLQKRLVTLNAELTAGGRGRNEFYLKKEIRETEEQITRLQERLANLNQSIIVVNKNLSEMTKQEREREAERVRASINSLSEQKGRLEDFLRWLQENQGQFSTGVFGINIVASREAWNIYAGIVNELERMNIITREQKDRFLDNAGVTQDIKDIITIINNRVNDLNSAIANQRALLDTLTKYDETRLQAVEDLAKNYDALVRLYDLQGQKEKAIVELQKKASFLQSEINKAKANGINTTQLEIEYYKTINDINERRKRQEEEIRQKTDDLIKKYDKLVRLYDLQGEKEKAISELQKKANFLQSEINKLKASGVDTIELEIEYYETMNDIAERQKRQQEEINKLINERINKLKQVVELGGLDVENYKDIQTITKILKESGLEGMDFLKTLKDIGVNISSEFLPKTYLMLPVC